MPMFALIEVDLSNQKTYEYIREYLDNEEGGGIPSNMGTSW